MNGKKTFWVMALLLGCLLVTAAPIQAALNWYIWNNGDGLWYNSTLWTKPPAFIGYPNGTTVGAQITGSNVTVTLPQPQVSGEDSIRIGGLQVDAGNTLSLTATTGARLWFDNGANNPTVINNGTILVNIPAAPGGGMYLLSTGTVTFTGSGEIVLGTYPNNYFDGDNFVNDTFHTIRGGGRVSTNGGTALNYGKIIADNGMLMINHAINNQGILGASGAGNYLQIYNTTCTGGQYNPGTGSIQLWTATLNDPTFGPGTVTTISTADNLNGNIYLDPGTNLIVDNAGQLHLGGSAIVTNNGTIHVNAGVSDAVVYAEGTVTLTGPGSLVLNGKSNSLLAEGAAGVFINDTPQTIQGGGTITGHTNNKGKIIANNGALRINQPVTGTGSVSVTDGATLEIWGNDLQCGDLTLRHLAALTLNNNRSLEVKGNFSFAMTDPANWNWMYQNVLQMSGGGASKQSLEVGGKDFGADAAGFSNNFNPTYLNLAGAGTYVYLVDNINNGLWPAREALYVGGAGHQNTTLNVPPGTTLNLNRIRLYAYLNNNIHQVKGGEGALFGGGQIIDLSEKPGPRTLPGIVTPLLLD
jgi:hypothetical protein